ncbi:MAG: hypothetical protein D6B28_08490 [Gammaproteobacteria bacterium]|nr:MAG: hypothetical protein D6B28_08490 [Gammaproteobacteria bacterium]
MKKLLIATVSIVASLFTNAQAAQYKEIKLEAIPGYYAEIDNMSGVNYGPEKWTWGAKTEHYVLKDKKSILTFDTSKIPANAKIEYVYIFAAVEQYNGFDGMNSGEMQEYIHNNLVAEFAPIGGFGGSYFPTAYDYYSFAIDSTPLDSYGLMLIDQSSYANINRYGFTQLRIGFKQNPAMVNMVANFQFSGSGSEHPQILIRYTEQ